MHKNVLKVIGFLLSICSATLLADEHTDFVDIATARAYLQDNPYLIYYCEGYEDATNCIFKVESITINDKKTEVTGPVILEWKEDKHFQCTYYLPKKDKKINQELMGNYHYGFYKALRRAIPLEMLFSPTGGTWTRSLTLWLYPAPAEIEGIDKEYQKWWNKNASSGPPVLHNLIDSVLSAADGGRIAPPETFVDSNHCPFDGCAYGEWITVNKLPIFPKPKSTKTINQINAGDTFTAITGNVYVKPLKVIANNDVEAYDSLY